MAHPKIILSGYFSNISLGKISILDEAIYDLSQLKFDGEDGTSITKHIYDFFKFCEYYKINDEDFSFVTFFLALEGHVNRWCHTLPTSSILLTVMDPPTFRGSPQYEVPTRPHTI